VEPERCYPFPMVKFGGSDGRNPFLGEPKSDRTVLPGPSAWDRAGICTIGSLPVDPRGGLSRENCRTLLASSLPPKLENG